MTRIRGEQEETEGTEREEEKRGVELGAGEGVEVEVVAGSGVERAAIGEVAAVVEAVVADAVEHEGVFGFKLQIANFELQSVEMEMCPRIVGGAMDTSGPFGGGWG